MNKTIQTWLPLFPGFYETNFDFRHFIEEDEIDKLTNEEYDEKILEHNKRIINLTIEFIKEQLKDIVTDIRIEEIYSLKEYNYNNDSINVKIKINSKKLSKLIYKEKEKINKYLNKNYSSKDGFIPFYSNNFYVWEKETKKFTDFNSDKHYLGAILNALLSNKYNALVMYVLNNIN